MIAILPVLGGFTIVGADVLVLPGSGYQPRDVVALDFQPTLGGVCVPVSSRSGVRMLGGENAPITFTVHSQALDPLNPQRQAFEISLTPGHPADIDFDGGVNVNDLLAFLSAYRNGYDFNADGRLTFQDLIEYVSQYRASSLSGAGRPYPPPRLTITPL